MQRNNITDQIAELIDSPNNFGTANLELPVGTIIPYFPPDKIGLPMGWLLCAGQRVNDPDSPLFGYTLPQLTDGQFLMGSTAESSFGMAGGTNFRPMSKLHSHGGATGRGGGSRGADNGLDWSASTSNHFHTIQPESSHSHGEENRPPFFGVLYIVKAKNV